MSVQSEMPCWEIIKCNKKETCLFAENNKKPCWEMVGTDKACSFHVCVNCLVYLAKHKDSPLTEEAFCSILERRQNFIHIAEYKCPPSPTLIDSALTPKGTLNNGLTHQHHKVSRWKLKRDLWHPGWLLEAKFPSIQFNWMQRKNLSKITPQLK